MLEVLQQQMMMAQGVPQETTLVPDGLVAHWKMDAVAGAALVDSVGGYDAVLTGGLHPAAGVMDSGSVHFHRGSANVGIVPQRIDHGPVFTVCLWAKFGEVTNQWLLGQRSSLSNPTQEWQIHNYGGAGTIQANFWNTSGTVATVNTNFKPDPDEWVFVEMDVAEDEIARIRINETTLHGITTGVLASGATNFVLGRAGFSANYYLDGRLDDVRIYNRVLTAEERGILYAAGAPADSLNLMNSPYDNDFEIWNPVITDGAHSITRTPNYGIGPLGLPSTRVVFDSSVAPVSSDRCYLATTAGGALNPTPSGNVSFSLYVKATNQGDSYDGFYFNIAATGQNYPGTITDQWQRIGGYKYSTSIYNAVMFGLYQIGGASNDYVDVEVCCAMVSDDVTADPNLMPEWEAGA